jgi:hypothetical protein
MRFTITHQGVPIGEVELPAGGEWVAVPVSPLPAYESIRPLVRAASVALSRVALAGAGETALPQIRSQTTLHRAAELGRALELRDAAGALVPTDFIDLTDWPGGEPAVAAIVGLRDSHAARPAVERPPTLGGSDSVPPAG